MLPPSFLFLAVLLDWIPHSMLPNSLLYAPVSPAVVWLSSSGRERPFEYQSFGAFLQKSVIHGFAKSLMLTRAFITGFR